MVCMLVPFFMLLQMVSSFIVIILNMNVILTKNTLYKMKIYNYNKIKKNYKIKSSNQMEVKNV